MTEEVFRSSSRASLTLETVSSSPDEINIMISKNNNYPDGNKIKNMVLIMGGSLFGTGFFIGHAMK